MASAGIVSGARQQQLISVAEEYFAGIARKDMSQVPWHEDLVFRGPLAPGFPEPVRGRDPVMAWFSGLYAALGTVEVIEHLVSPDLRSIATRADVHVGSGVLRVLDRFVVDEQGRIVEQENHYDPRPVLGPPDGAMSSSDRELLVDILESSRDTLAAAIAGVRDAVWLRRPSDGQWSPAECAEHLALSEQALLELVRSRILAAPAEPAKTPEVQGKDGVVIQAMRDRSAKVKTFDFLEPSGRWQMKQDVLEAFLTRRAETRKYARTTTDAVHFHFSRLPALGLLSAYQWLLLMASHTERHVAQMLDAAT